MSVTVAAGRLGIGRPALSNLLNGRAALSLDMANRLARAFGVDAADLLRQQTEFEREPRADEAKVVAVRGYAPPFLTIKATDIETWATKNLDARHLLPVLLRRLIHSTGRGLRLVDFPGYDNAERKGNDGAVEADEATAWIPAGKSIWEFGVTEDSERKANEDYTKRTSSVPRNQRLETNYVQVTPRNWKKTLVLGGGQERAQRVEISNVVWTPVILSNGLKNRFQRKCGWRRNSNNHATGLKR